MDKVKKNKHKVDVIIPAYKAHGTIFQCLASIAQQSILDDVRVTIVNDACPEGDYKEFVDLYKRYFDIQEVKLDKNGGPGVARQAGIDATEGEFFTCIDADDTFSNHLSLEMIRTAIEEPLPLPDGRKLRDGYKCVSSTFIQMGEDLKQMLPHQNDMVWMFGKFYRRKFIEDYGIHFNETRANEDTGFNTWVRLICDNPGEQVRFIPETTYFWHLKEDSITRINDGQYGFDQCLCGWTDNMIWAIDHASETRPFGGQVMQWRASVMMELYYYYVECVARKKIFAEQAWEYVKKYYNKCYAKVDGDISEKVFSEVYSMMSIGKYRQGHMMGFIPHIGIKEFMDKLRSEKYDPEEIYNVWDRMAETEEGREAIQNNIACGVCGEGYTNRPNTKIERKEIANVADEE